MVGEEKHWEMIPAEETVDERVSFPVRSWYISNLSAYNLEKNSHGRVYPALFRTRRGESER